MIISWNMMYSATTGTFLSVYYPYLSVWFYSISKETHTLVNITGENWDLKLIAIM